MSTAQKRDRSSELAGGDGIVDFAPIRLREDASLRNAAQLLLDAGGWGIPVTDRSGRYLGTCTLRSIAACALPVTEGNIAAGETVADAGQGLAGGPRLQAALDRPVTQGLDLEVPAIRLSTALPQLLLVLCRRSPIVPIVSDSGMQLLGVASLARAVRALCGM